MTNRQNLNNALDRYMYWLEVTGNPRLAAGCANRQCGLSLSVKDYKKLLKTDNRPPDESDER